MSQSNQVRAPANWAGYLNVVAALSVCALNLCLAAVPLVGMTALPCLLGSVCWASSALAAVGYRS